MNVLFVCWQEEDDIDPRDLARRLEKIGLVNTRSVTTYDNFEGVLHDYVLNEGVFDPDQSKNVEVDDVYKT